MAWRVTSTRRLQGVAGVSMVLVLAGCGMVHEAATPSIAVDARSPIRLSAADREHLRAGMRGYLESIQGVMEALAARRSDRLAGSARKSGMASLHTVSVATAVSLPPDFTLLSLDTHEKFDSLARLATQNAGRKALLDHTGSILANCSACHAMYRVFER